MSKNISSEDIRDKVQSSVKMLFRYRGILFFLFIALVYGFILFRINALVNVDPSQGTLTQTSQATKQPHIDGSAVKKIQDLRDNSVGVQSLFNQARQNPFQE